MTQKTLDIVTSAYNEEQCVLELFRRIEKVMSLHSNYEWRLIFCDNCSTDKTWELIQEIALESQRVLGIRMSRTFSLDAALTMGIDIATADAVVLMASDLQDPPEVISDFIREFEAGYDQVVARIIRREHSPLMLRIFSGTFYWLVGKLTSGLLPRDVSDFRLISKKVYVAVRGLQERHRFLRGLIAWTGFKTATVEIERPQRYAGESKFRAVRLGKILRWAITHIFAHSSVPLFFLSSFGFFLSIFSLLITTACAIYWFASGVPFAGFGTLVGVILVGFSLTMLAIGVCAHYIALIYDEVKGRPHYIVSNRTDE